MQAILSPRRVSRLVAFVAALAALVLAAFFAGDNAPAAAKSLTYTLIQKAQPDECFNGIGVAYPPGPPCATGQPKVNGAYVWSMVEPPGAVWFGTAANVPCAAQAESSFTAPTPRQSSNSVCEYASGTYDTPCLPRFRDVRRPHIYRYDTASAALVDKTPPSSDKRLKSVQGIRLSAANGGVLLFGGPDCASGVVDLFAFNQSTGAYLGSSGLSGYIDVRRGVVVGGVLYIGAKKTRGGGAILRWTGTLSRPFQFSEVGTIDAEAAEVAEYQGRVVAATWPNESVSGAANGGPPAGLWLSPAIPSSGLTAKNASQWTKVWSANTYEPDTVTRATYGIGMMASYSGYLYFGTMHRQGQAKQAHDDAYGADTTGFRSARTKRATTIFRAANLGAANQQVDLVYGETQFWVESPANTWTLANNLMNATPLLGSSGFGNPSNNYEWSMAVFNNKLYVGTLDSGPSGADLWEFPDSTSAAVAITEDGFGNSSNAGVRTMIADGSNLWIGTSNPDNLRTDPNNPPLGGWEFARLAP
jgi:hypothetical protein